MDNLRFNAWMIWSFTNCMFLPTYVPGLVRRLVLLLHWCNLQGPRCLPPTTQVMIVITHSSV